MAKRPRSILTKRDPAVTPRGFHQFYTPEEKEETIRALCEHLVTNGIGTMVAFLAARGTTWAVVYYWMCADPGIMHRIRQAQFAGSFVTAEEILRIADDRTEDYEIDGTGKLRAVPETVARAKLRIDARWRMLSCIAPSVWATRMAQTGVASDETEADAEERRASVLSDAERAHRVAQLLGSASSRPKAITVVDDANGPVD